MYAGKKYMVPELVQECCKCLSTNLNLDNVIDIFETSLYLDEMELQKKWMDLICSNSKDVLTRPDTLSVSRLFMQAILDEDHLPVREVVLYKITMCWGIRQFKNQNGGEDPTDLELREVLGDLLYKIRFPAMLPKEFSEISTGSDLLTAAEKESIYCYLVTKKQLDQLQFSVNKRVNTEMFVDRTELCSSTHWFFDPYFF